VARPLAFDVFEHDGLHSYLHIAHDGLVERHWPGLLQEWGEGPTPFMEYGITDSEDRAIYQALIWRLTAGLQLYGIPRFHREAGTRAAGEPFALVDWEYEIENEQGPALGEIRGFVPAPSSVRLTPPPGPWQPELADKAGLFELPVFAVFRDVLTGLQGDATAELNVFGLADRADSTILDALSQPAPPRLAEVLGPADVFVDICIGVDLGFADVLLIQSHNDLAVQLDPLVAEYNAAIETYEGEIDEIIDMESFLQRIELLVNLGDEGEVEQ
jgi:hypothetical protein